LGHAINQQTEFEEYNPVEANELPYVDGPVYFDTCYLDQNCPFINAGVGYIDETPLIGRTTDINGTPDSNFVDLGFHPPNWNYSNEPNIIPTISGELPTILLEIDPNDSSLKKPEFTIDDAYSFERILSRQHPDNRHIRPKIRQQLQILRDLGYLEFVRRGQYHWIRG